MRLDVGSIWVVDTQWHEGWTMCFLFQEFTSTIWVLIVMGQMFLEGGSNHMEDPDTLRNSVSTTYPHNRLFIHRFHFTHSFS